MGTDLVTLTCLLLPGPSAEIDLLADFPPAVTFAWAESNGVVRFDSSSQRGALTLFSLRSARSEKVFRGKLFFQRARPPSISSPNTKTWVQRQLHRNRGQVGRMDFSRKEIWSRTRS